MQFKTLKYFSMAVLALAVAACGNDDIDLSPDQQPSEGIPFTATISASASAATRALSGPDGEGKINASWAEGDKVALIYKVGKNQYYTPATVQSVDGGKATITATLAVTLTEETAVKLVYPTSALNQHNNIDQDLLNAQDGTLPTIAAQYDVRQGSGTLIVKGSAATLKEDVTMETLFAIWKLTLNNPSTRVTLLSDQVGVLGSATLAEAGSTLYMAVKPTPSAKVRVLTNNGDNYYLFTQTGVKIEAAKYYQSEVNTTAMTVRNLQEISSFTASECCVMTQSPITEGMPVQIADGATVVLKDVSINANGGWTTGSYAGITCLGDATIILEGNNEVKGHDPAYPGIYVPANKSLTITGIGSLTASSNGKGCGIGGGEASSPVGVYTSGNIRIEGGTITAIGGAGAAGIGAGYGNNTSSVCGDITIIGGTVVARGGEYAAGIGTGKGRMNSQCGNILISGGSVAAYGGNSCPGIGCGYYHAGDHKVICGTITITDGVTNVLANEENPSPSAIGKSYGNNENNSSCGTITIGGTVYWDGTSFQNNGDGYLGASVINYVP